MSRKYIVLLTPLMFILGLIMTACIAGAKTASEAEVISTANTSDKISERFPEGTTLEILQWNHFVHRYDQWFDPFAETWGDTVGVEVTVGHISLTELHGALAAAAEVGQGPTLIEFIIGPSLYIEDVHDLSDINRQAQEMFGEQIEICRTNSYLPATDTYYGYCVAWVPDPGNYNIELWSQIGMPNGPQTWYELLGGGKRIKDEFGGTSGCWAVTRDGF